MPLTVIDKDKFFRGGANIAPDPDSGKELGEIVADIQTAVNLVENGIVDGDFSGTALGRLTRTGAGAYAVVQDSLANVIAPTANNDATGGAGGKQKGFAVGSLWVDVTADKAYVCLDATNTAAVWRQIDVTAASVATAGAVMDADFALATAGRMTRTGAGAYAVIQDNLAAAAAPTVAADSAAGYGPGSMWFDTTAHRMYVCDSAAVGAAIWIGSSMKDNVFAGPPGVGSDNLLGYSVGSTWIDTVTAIRWKCQSAATGAAVWNPEVKHNLAAAVDPVVGDDTADGYAVGSLWINTTADPRRVFQCVNPAGGAAVWRQLNAMSNLVAVVAPNPAVDDITLGYDVGSVWVDTATDLVYICADNTNGAAVWRLSLNVVAAGGELAGNYPNPTVADGVLDAANALAGAVAGLVVDKGVPSSCVIAFDNAGAVQRPADGASYTFSIGGGALAAIEARDVVVDQYDFLRSAGGAEEADTILMAAAFAAAINANTVIGLRIRAEVYGGAGDGRWYVACYTRLQADITAGSALTCVLAGGQPGVYQARATAIAASKSQLFPFTYAVTAQDVLAGEIRFSFGCTAVKAYHVDILTAVDNYTRIAWTGTPSVAGGVLTIDNAGGAVDWAAGNIIRGWLVGTVA